jgi:Cu+-exporting ATPase
MTVDRSKAVTSEVDGHTYYFCSAHCLQAFEADPDRYGGASGVPAESGRAQHHVHAHH